jgi:hypothetical protein
MKFDGVPDPVNQVFIGPIPVRLYNFISRQFAPNGIGAETK